MFIANLDECPELEDRKRDGGQKKSEIEVLLARDTLARTDDSSYRAFGSLLTSSHRSERTLSVNCIQQLW